VVVLAFVEYGVPLFLGGITVWHRARRAHVVFWAEDEGGVDGVVVVELAKCWCLAAWHEIVPQLGGHLECG
jgi:hypothetical protein